MCKELIEYEEATNALEELKLEDILRDGEETPFTFDADRAKAKLDKLKRYLDLVNVVRCINCEHRIEVTKYSKSWERSFIFADCKELGRYLGDLGFCSLAKRKERNNE